MKRFYILTILFVTLTSSIFAQVRSAGDAYTAAVHRDYLQRKGIPQSVRDGIAQLSGSDLELQRALEFLYAYMPQNDLVDYDLDFFRQQVDIAYEARNTFAWGKLIPEEIFRHFVLVYRVNNEDLDTARAYIFHQLKSRLQGMDMYEAALEVNHWCHEHVDYQPADVRTSAPLATIRTSHGRCGEESTLTVTALRAVGIPARQCYTPRWAHCDDNHAWVEVWVNGTWRFLGACEPDPELNMGWFAVPSSRTMMVHTNVFGRYQGPEEVNHQSPYYARINVLSNYADTVQLTVRVVDKNHRPVEGAEVQFRLYNYAEYYTLASRQSDSNGEASLITGKGDLLIWVRKGDHFNYAKADCRTQRTLTLNIDEEPVGDYVERLTMCPPVGGATLAKSTPERTALNDRRKQQEDAQREAYRHTFPTPEKLKDYHNANFTDEQLYDIIRRSEGNHQQIMAFLDKHATVDTNCLIAEYIAALSDKDLRDAPADVLEEQLEYYRDRRYPKEVFVKGILPARISNELLRPDRTFLGTSLKRIFHTRPTIQQLTTFIDTAIVVDEESNYYNCPISPVGVRYGKVADSHSLGIFFVALCRSFGVPAYMDNSNGALYAWEEGAWHHVILHGKNRAGESAEVAAPANATLILHNPNHYIYYPNYTLQRLVNGEYVTYDFENDARVETDPIRLTLPAGKYCLSTGNRYSNGDVLSQMEFFTLPANGTVEKTITLLPLTERIHNYGRLDVDQTRLGGKTLQGRLSESGKDKMAICWGTPGTEPVNHLMKELEQYRHEYEEWGGVVLFAASNDQWKGSSKLPKNLVVTQEDFQSTLNRLLEGMVEKHEGENPVCVVVDKNGTILFFSEGYHIGLGNLMINELR